MIAIKALTKTIGNTPVLSNIDLSIARGEGVALAGSDQAGRTALMRLLATLVPPSSGQLVIGDLDAVRDLYRVRRLVAYAGATGVRASRLRVAEHIRAIAQARRQSAAVATEAIAVVGLDGSASIEALPASLRRRVPVAAAFASGAELLLLDNVLDLFDERSREGVGAWLHRARDGGTTIIVNAADGTSVPDICQRTLGVEAGRLSEVTPSRRGALSRELVTA